MDRLKLATQSIPDVPEKKRKRGHQVGQKLSEEHKEKIRQSYRARLWTYDSGLPRPGAANGESTSGKE
jgi:hypothetical protein